MKIRNVVFDMGDVLLSFRPMVYARFYTDSDWDGEKVAAAVFGGREWQALDAGRMTEEEALTSICGGLPERLHRAALETLAHWSDHLEPIVDTNDMLPILKDMGYGLYLLSNAGLRLRSFGPVRLPYWDCFDGAVISAEEGVVKPDPAIYNCLFARYGLAPETCFFVDDRVENCAASRKLGMSAHCFDGNAESLRAAMRRAEICV